MRDFLTNLAERSLPTTPTVCPRLPSIFEPPSVNGAAFFRNAEKTELPAVEQHREVPADGLPRLRSLGRIMTPTLAAQSVAPGSNATLASPESCELRSSIPPTRTPVEIPERITPLSRAAPATEGGSRTDEVSAAPLRPQLSVEQTSSPSSVPSRARQTSGDGRRKDQVDGVASRAPSDHKRGPSSANKDASNDSTRNRPHELDAKKILEVIAQERDAHRQLIQVRDIHAVSGQATSERLITPVQEQKNPCAPPSISVTIGRVEIRAVAPASQQRAKPRPAPVLSLENYLRQRAAGGSR